MITFRNETDAIHYKTYSVFFGGRHCYARDYVEMWKINRCLNCHELTHLTHSCSHKTRCVHCSSTEHLSAEHPKLKCKECKKDKTCLHNNLKCINCNGNHTSNDPGCPVWMKHSGLLKDTGPTQQRQPLGGCNKHMAKLANIMKPAKVSQKQSKKKTQGPTLQDDKTNNKEGKQEMESDG